MQINRRHKAASASAAAAAQGIVMCDTTSNQFHLQHAQIWVSHHLIDTTHTSTNSVTQYPPLAI